MRILIGILLVGAGWPGICLGQLAWAETHLKIQAEPEDKEVIGTFSFQNGGSETVTILNVTSSCGCTVAELDRKVYDPGESGSIRATFSVGSRVGTQIKRITVRSDQDGGSSQVLILETRIPEILRVHPKLVLWQVGQKPEPKRVLLTVGVAEEVSINRVSTQGSGLFTSELEVIEPGRRYALTVTPADTAEAQRSTVSLHTDYPADDPRVYRVFAFIK